MSNAMLERVEKYISSSLDLLNDGSEIQIRLDLPNQSSYNCDQWDRIVEFIKLFGDLLDSFPLALQSFDEKPIVNDYIRSRNYYLLQAQRRKAAKAEEDGRAAAQRRKAAKAEEDWRAAAQRREAAKAERARRAAAQLREWAKAERARTVAAQRRTAAKAEKDWQDFWVLFVLPALLWVFIIVMFL